MIAGNGWAARAPGLGRVGPGFALNPDPRQIQGSAQKLFLLILPFLLASGWSLQSLS